MFGHREVEHGLDVTVVEGIRHFMQPAVVAAEQSPGRSLAAVIQPVPSIQNGWFGVVRISRSPTWTLMVALFG